VVEESRGTVYFVGVTRTWYSLYILPDFTATDAMSKGDGELPELR
jgi:hypothetical protein